MRAGIIIISSSIIKWAYPQSQSKCGPARVNTGLASLLRATTLQAEENPEQDLQTRRYTVNSLGLESFIRELFQ